MQKEVSMAFDGEWMETTHNIISPRSHCRNGNEGFFLSLPGHCNPSTSALHYLLWCDTWLKYCQTPRVFLSGEQTLRDSPPEPGELNLDSPHPCEEPHGMGRIPVQAGPALDARILQPSTSPARKMLAGFVSLTATQSFHCSLRQVL